MSKRSGINSEGFYHWFALWWSECMLTINSSFFFKLRFPTWASLVMIRVVVTGPGPWILRVSIITQLMYSRSWRFCIVSTSLQSSDLVRPVASAAWDSATFLNSFLTFCRASGDYESAATRVCSVYWVVFTAARKKPANSSTTASSSNTSWFCKKKERRSTPSGT